jgi:hypothetical protein
MKVENTVQDQTKVCFDRILPVELQAKVRQAALQENPANAADSALEAAAIKSKLWQPGRSLRICFLDGTPSVQEKVQKYADQWMEFANIHFVFGNAPDAEILISFQQPGSWSAIGTDALVKEYFPPNQPTMNFGWLTPTSSDDEYSRVVLHEFGHALGMIHEHQNPVAGISWNKPAVYAALGGPPNNWDNATVDHNMFEKYSRFRTQFTAFDSQSIMLYSFPASWTNNNMEFPNNSVLSETDKAFIRARYPASV